MQKSKKLKDILTYAEFYDLKNLTNVNFCPESEMKPDIIHKINNKIITYQNYVRELEILREKLILRTNDPEDCKLDMKKYVGITSRNPYEIKQEWEKKGRNVLNFVLIQTGLTYKQAQDLEDRYKKEGYQAHQGEEIEHGAVYSVFTYDY